jgi:hypothetical protein
MKALTLIAAACAAAVVAEPEHIKPRALFTIETAPGQTVQITEEERWELSSVSQSGLLALLGLTGTEWRLWQSFLRYHWIQRRGQGCQSISTIPIKVQI